LSKTVIVAFARCAHFGKNTFNPACRCSDCRRKAWNDKTKKERMESIQSALAEQKRRAELNKAEKQDWSNKHFSWSFHV